MMRSTKSFGFSIIVLTMVFLGAWLFLSLKPSKTHLPPCQQQLSKAVCEKIGQMLIVGFGGLRQDGNGKILWEDPNSLVFTENSNIAKMIKEYHVGGVILFTKPFRHAKTKAFIRARNIQNPEQVKDLNIALQQYSKKMREKNGFAPLPLIISIDQEGGMIDRLPAELGFPLRTWIPQALGANEERVLDDPEKKQNALLQTEQYASKMADELRASQFNTDFVPSVDLNLNPLNPIIGGLGRSFSANPVVVYDQAQIFIKVLNAKGIITAIKHFPGHGSSRKDSHIGLVDVTDTYQKEKELFPYRELIKNGFQDLVMTTHVINGQLDNTQCKAGATEDRATWCPGTLSHATLTQLLREELGFKGVVVSDDMTMGAIVKEYPLDIAFEKAILAGVDMFIVSNNDRDDTEIVINTIAKLLKEDRIKESDIDRAYQHIVELKKRQKND